MKKIRKGLDQPPGVSHMGRDMGEAHNVIMDIQFAYGVVGGVSAGNNLDRTSMDGTGEGRGGISACDTRDTDPHNGTCPDLGHALASGHGHADGWHHCGDSEGASTCLYASCDLNRARDWDSVGRSR